MKELRMVNELAFSLFLENHSLECAEVGRSRVHA